MTMFSITPQHDYLVGIDSDGCVFDTMELKHKECFIPNIIRYWKLQAISKYAREAAEFVKDKAGSLTLARAETILSGTARLREGMLLTLKALIKQMAGLPGQRMIAIEEALEIVELWLNTPFEGGRHLTRIQKIDAQ